MDYTVAPAPAVSEIADTSAYETDGAASGDVSERQQRLTGYLYESTFSPWLLVVGLGLSALLGGLHARLVWNRRKARVGDYHHDHHRDHDHPSRSVRPGDLWTMEVSGGLVPYPEASGVMLATIVLDQVALGLGLILMLSLGLAAMLIAVGVLVLHSHSKLVDRLGKPGSPWL